MIVDTSALIAILRDEPDAAEFARALLEAPSRRISATNYVETGAVIDSSRDPVASRKVDELLKAAGIGIEPVTAEQARIARQAYHDFGRASGHPAQLNFGDCFAYALAVDAGERLLFKGNGFARTDVKPALK